VEPSRSDNLDSLPIHVCGHGMQKRGREGGKQDRTKHITSAFNDRSTGSCICLRLDLYMSHGNEIRVENDMHNV